MLDFVGFIGALFQFVGALLMANKLLDRFEGNIWDYVQMWVLGLFKKGSGTMYGENAATHTPEQEGQANIIAFQGLALVAFGFLIQAVVSLFKIMCS